MHTPLCPGREPPPRPWLFLAHAMGQGQSLKAVKVDPKNEGKVRSVVFSPHEPNMLASAGLERQINISNIEGSKEGERGKPWMQLKGHQGFVRCIAMCIADPTLLASASDDKSVLLWDLGGGAVRGELLGHTDFVTCVAFSPHDQGILASASYDKRVILWHVESCQMEREITAHEYAVHSVCFSPLDRDVLASGSGDSLVLIHDLREGTVRHTLKWHRDAVWSVAFSYHDRRTLASGSGDKKLVIWNSQDGQVQKELKGHTDAVHCVAFSPRDRTLLASASADGTVLIWDYTRSSDIRTKLEQHKDAVYAVAFSPHERQLLASGAGDKRVLLWRLEDAGGPDGHRDSIKSNVSDKSEKRPSEAGESPRSDGWELLEYATGEVVEVNSQGKGVWCAAVITAVHEESGAVAAARGHRFTYDIAFSAVGFDDWKAPEFKLAPRRIRPPRDAPEMMLDTPSLQKIGRPAAVGSAGKADGSDEELVLSTPQLQKLGSRGGPAVKGEEDVVLETPQLQRLPSSEGVRSGVGPRDAPAAGGDCGKTPSLQESHGKSVRPKRMLVQAAVPSPEVSGPQAASQTPPPASSSSAEAAKPVLTLSDLQDIDVCKAHGVDLRNKETYLPDEEFQSLFKMDKATFAAQQGWKRDKQKKGLGIF